MEKKWSYEQALEYIHACPRLSLMQGEAGRRTEKFFELTGISRNIPAVHVTGTNGKGSFSTMLSYMLRSAGKKTGLFISPYVLCYRERMQINGEMIPQSTLARLVQELKPAVETMNAENLPINEFILGFGIALKWFAEEGCDAVVIEAGVGGAHDATNALVDPCLSVLMGIGLEHTGVLGNTLEEIAADKAAIIKGNPALLYPEQVDEVIGTVMRRCAEVGSKLTMPSFTGVKILREDFQGTEFLYDGKHWKLTLLGRYQVKNAVMAITAGRMLNLTDDAIQEGLCAAHFPCRLELVSQNPPVLIDGGHNVHGMTALAESIHILMKGRKPILLTGMMRDKDFSDALAVILPEVSKVYAVHVDNPRSAMAHEVAQAVTDAGGDAIEAGEWQDGLKCALDAAKKAETPLLICGSLFLAADVRGVLTGEKYE